MDNTTMEMFQTMMQMGNQGNQAPQGGGGGNNLEMMMNMMTMMGEVMVKGGGKGLPPIEVAPGTKTKRRVCQFFLEGRCAKGFNCTFAHGEWEIGMPQGTGELICSFHLQGHCEKGEMCSFSHGPDQPTQYGKRPPPGAQEQAANAMQAQQFGQSGFGQTGPGASVDDDISALNKEMQAIQNEIDRLANGGAPTQQAAPAAAGPPGTGLGFRKVRLCTFYEQGRCTKGEACAFAHGEHELGMPQNKNAAASQDPPGLQTMPSMQSMQSMFQAQFQGNNWNARSTPY